MSRFRSSVRLSDFSQLATLVPLNRTAAVVAGGANRDDLLSAEDERENKRRHLNSLKTISEHGRLLGVKLGEIDAALARLDELPNKPDDDLAQQADTLGKKRQRLIMLLDKVQCGISDSNATCSTRHNLGAQKLRVQTALSLVNDEIKRVNTAKWKQSQVPKLTAAPPVPVKLDTRKDELRNDVRQQFMRVAEERLPADAFRAMLEEARRRVGGDVPVAMPPRPVAATKEASGLRLDTLAQISQQWSADDAAVVAKVEPPLAKSVQPVGKKLCSWPGCDQLKLMAGMCNEHYWLSNGRKA